MTLCITISVKMLDEIQIDNNFQIVTKKPEDVVVDDTDCINYVDLTEDTPKKTTHTNILAEFCAKGNVLNNGNTFDTGTASSITSWTSSSDDILYSNNCRVTQQ